MVSTVVRHHVRRKPKGGYTDVVRHHRSVKGYVDLGTHIEKPSEGYNGHYNYNVWDVMLYIGNEEDLNKRQYDLYNNYYEGKITEDQFMRGLNTLGANAHQRSDVRNKKLTDIEINELRKELLDGYREHSDWRTKEGD